MKRFFYVFLAVLFLTGCKNQIYVYSGDVDYISRITPCECRIETNMTEKEITELSKTAVEQGSVLVQLIGGYQVDVRKDDKLYRFEICNKKDAKLLVKTWNYFRYQETWLKKDMPEEPNE